MPLRRFFSCRYCISHLLVKMQQIQDVRVQITVNYFSFFPDIVLVVALGLGLYTEWTFTKNITISVIALLGIFVFAISFALRFYFGMVNFGRSLFHIWLGGILGIIAFSNQSNYEESVLHEVMEFLFIISMGLGWFWNILERFLHIVKYEAILLTVPEGLESVGLIAASLVTGMDAVSLSFLILAYVLHIIALRMKSMLAIVSLLCLLLISAFVYFPDLKLTVNKYALVCFVGRHSFQPIIDFYFSRLTTLERWQSFFRQRKSVRHLTVLGIFFLQLSLGILIGVRSTTHKEWFVVFPIYMVFAVLWLLCHLLFFITCWKLMGKITECNLTYQSLSDELQSYIRIMAAKGVRHFSLISQRLICLSVLTTVILLGIGWETRNGYSLSLVFMVLPIECMTLSLVWSLGESLGGTCTGYAIIAPINKLRPDGTTTIITSASIQDGNAKSTATLSYMQQFFNFNMIENYGCDYSTSGLSPDYIQSKIKTFFDRRTSDGPRFDTYILYYSGEVYETGEWALTGNDTLKLDTILEWWTNKNAGSGSRLLLVLDTPYSYIWTKTIRYISHEFVAIQTCRYSKPSDPESGTQTIGTFTKDWVCYNLGEELEQEWSKKDRNVRALYSVSKCWTDFTFHLPTTSDFEQHWDSNFPRITKPLIKAVNFPSAGSVCCCCDCIFRCLKRKQMKWLPPKHVDTGHGFKLVHS
ncbi:transmembrane protein 168 [Patella vulgata]|uniref:transmembrane protein 168 n=1 Tax=Patella vulgata TaxID=6465 RepID=UPI0024A96407|nr:transmembrane protein 168 [Patella vulgata]XP_050412937.2 transmembrane protein 168 [Patella vulgata]